MIRNKPRIALRYPAGRGIPRWYCWSANWVGTGATPQSAYDAWANPYTRRPVPMNRHYRNPTP